MVSKCIGVSLRAVADRRAILALSLAGAVLAGCNTHMNYEPVAYVPVSADDRHTIEVTQNTVRLEVPVHGGVTRLPYDVRADVEAFLYDYTTSGSSRLTIAHHRDPTHPMASTAILGEIQRLVGEAGVSQGAVAYAYYPNGYAGRDAPILMSFESYVAVPPQCGDWTQPADETYENQPYPNMGCAAQANLAAMVADPRDLMQPRNMTRPHAGRRDVVLESYRTGAGTEADTSESSSGTVSEVGDE